jgi:hypothetical protein
MQTQPGALCKTYKPTLIFSNDHSIKQYVMSNVIFICIQINNDKNLVLTQRGTIGWIVNYKCQILS